MSEGELHRIELLDQRKHSHNAKAGSVIGPFETEVIHWLGPWKSFEAVEYKTLEWVD